MAKKVNAELVEFETRARELGLTYGQLQKQETIWMIREAEAKKKRRKGKRGQ